MNYKYQLILLGSETLVRQAIIDQINTEISNLGLPIDILKIIEPKNLDRDYTGNQPTFAIYFCPIDGEFLDLEETEKLLLDGTMILPVVFNSYSDDIPSILSKQNAIKFEWDEINRIANITLEAFDLLRKTRKVFISYKRTESTSVAIQLYEALEAYNFDVFLDTHSIGKGESFQEELWHRMTDCDVVVLLNTPKFLESHWCKEEFAEAATKQIGLIQLVWPEHKIKEIEDFSYISYPIQLSEKEFIGGIYNDPDKSKLNPDFINIILREVESVRARNLAARQDSLITNFRTIAAKYGRNVTVQPEKFLTENHPNGTMYIYIPTIGIPQSTSHQAAELRKVAGQSNVSIRLIYDDLKIRKNWLKHLDWLNDNFKKDIKTLKKQNFQQWLQNP